MSIARASVRRPVLTLMVTLIVVVLGLIAFKRLQIDLLPSIELPTLTVRTQYDGADPLVMERLVTRIVEEIVATVPGIVELTSTSYEGNSSVKVSFAWGTSIDTAATDVLATLQDEISELPDDIVGPRVSKFDIDSFPVVLLGIASSLDPVELTQLLEDQIRYRFTRIAGVAQVDPWGGYNRELRVELDPEKITALGLPLNDIISNIRDANLDLPAGRLEQGRYQYTLRAPAEFVSLQQIAATVVSYRDGKPVYLSQVAEIKDTYEQIRRIIRVNGERGLRVAIRKEPGANTVEVAKQILQEVEEINRAFPQIKVTPVINQGNFIERSIANVSQSIVLGGSLAVLVLLFFLRNLRSTLVIALSIPISVVATFALLYFSGFTLNLMTLGGLALGVGMMVDSSIVVLENIYRRYAEHQMQAQEAAVEGTNEVASAVVAGSLTTLVIFLPLIFVQGVSGVLFSELAYVIMFSLFCALMVSLTLLPVLASRMLKNVASADGSMTLQSSAPSALENIYLQALRTALAHPLKTVVLTMLLFAGSLFLSGSIGSEFIPPSDEGEVRVSGEMEIGTRLDLIDKQSRILENRVKELVPEAVSSVVSITPSGTRGSSKAKTDIRISLLPVAQRLRSNAEIASDLRKKLDGQIAGMKIRTRAPKGQFLLQRILPNAEGITVEVRGYDLDTLDLLARQAYQKIELINGVSDVELSRDEGVPQREIHVVRDRVADAGLTVRDISDVIETAIAGSRAGEYRVDGNSYRILVQLANAQQRSIDEILDLTLNTPDGQRVSLRSLVTTSLGTGKVVIARKDQQRLVKLTANVAGRDMGSVALDIEAALADIPRPAGFDLLVGGEFEKQQESYDELIESLLLALLLVYMVLASQYESFRDPLIVMLSVPVAAIGVIVTLFLTDTTLNLQSGIGCIMLGGIVVNNAILLVDQAGRLLQQKHQLQEAIIEAGRRRLRPILMTTLTTILALLPLALGIGEGADAQAPLARAAVGGLLTSTLITLLLIPVIYALVHGRDRNSL